MSYCNKAGIWLSQATVGKKWRFFRTDVMHSDSTNLLHARFQQVESMNQCNVEPPNLDCFLVLFQTNVVEQRIVGCIRSRPRLVRRRLLYSAGCRVANMNRDLGMRFWKGCEIWDHTLCIISSSFESFQCSSASTKGFAALLKSVPLCTSLQCALLNER